MFKQINKLCNEVFQSKITSNKDCNIEQLVKIIGTCKTYYNSNIS